MVTQVTEPDLDHAHLLDDAWEDIVAEVGADDTECGDVFTVVVDGQAMVDNHIGRVLTSPTYRTTTALRPDGKVTFRTIRNQKPRERDLPRRNRRDRQRYAAKTEKTARHYYNTLVNSEELIRAVQDRRQAIFMITMTPYTDELYRSVGCGLKNRLGVKDTYSRTRDTWETLVDDDNSPVTGVVFGLEFGQVGPAHTRKTGDWGNRPHSHAVIIVDLTHPALHGVGIPVGDHIDLHRMKTWEVRELAAMTWVKTATEQWCVIPGQQHLHDRVSQVAGSDDHWATSHVTAHHWTLGGENSHNITPSRVTDHNGAETTLDQFAIAVSAYATGLSGFTKNPDGTYRYQHKHDQQAAWSTGFYSQNCPGDTQTRLGGIVGQFTSTRRNVDMTEEELVEFLDLATRTGQVNVITHPDDPTMTVAITGSVDLDELRAGTSMGLLSDTAGKYQSLLTGMNTGEEVGTKTVEATYRITVPSAEWHVTGHADFTSAAA